MVQQRSCARPCRYLSPWCRTVPHSAHKSTWFIAQQCLVTPATGMHAILCTVGALLWEGCAAVATSVAVLCRCTILHGGGQRPQRILRRRDRVVLKGTPHSSAPRTEPDWSGYNARCLPRPSTCSLRWLAARRAPEQCAACLVWQSAQQAHVESAFELGKLYRSGKGDDLCSPYAQTACAQTRSRTSATPRHGHGWRCRASHGTCLGLPAR